MVFDFSKLILLDGGFGTMLQKAGMKPGTLPELVNLQEPEMVEAIHRAYVEAGSQVLMANTFGCNRLKLKGTGHRVIEVVTAAISIAKKAANGRALVALDVGPLGQLLEPMGTMTFEQAYELFAEIMHAGQAAGADLVAIETMTDLYETKAALLAAKENTELPVFATMSFEENGRTFTGCTPLSMAHTLEGLGADAIGINCSLGPDQLTGIVAQLAEATRLPIIAKPNAGLPDPVDGHYSMLPDAFAKAMVQLVEAGASVVGGCCGTDPDYIRALADSVRDMKPVMRNPRPVSFVCSATLPLEINGVCPIGERINPTGKKKLQQALLSGDMDYVVSLALSQKDAGAAILDVNVGYPGVNEEELLPRVVKKLQSVIDLPLQLDSVNPKALEAALRVYNGKPAVNSVNASGESLDRILPLVKKYGAAVVGLTMDENGIPETAAARIAHARHILEAVLAAGIRKEDLWIDCLTMTVSAQQHQAAETLGALRYIREEMGLQTVLGVSNISFGLPCRQVMTQVFLAEALRSGLTLPIINPNQSQMMDVIAAHRALTGEDAQCAAYVDRFAQAVQVTEFVRGGQAAAAPSASASASISLTDAIRKGLKEQAAQLTREELKHRTGLEIVADSLIPALDRVGADYEKGVVFLPQLLSAAQAAQSVSDVISDSMSADGDAPMSKGRIIIATVKGDIHDIGKNIVRTVLKNYGYEVLDLGRDVPPSTIVDAAVRDKVRLVGLSALMTTTLPAMEETIHLLKQLQEPPVCFVGGAVVTEDFAHRIGADHYAKDAQAAVQIARTVFG